MTVYFSWISYALPRQSIYASIMSMVVRIGAVREVGRRREIRMGFMEEDVLKWRDKKGDYVQAERCNDGRLSLQGDSYRWLPLQHNLLNTDWNPVNCISSRDFTSTLSWLSR